MENNTSINKPVFCINCTYKNTEDKCNKEILKVEISPITGETITTLEKCVVKNKYFGCLDFVHKNTIYNRCLRCEHRVYVFNEARCKKHQDNIIPPTIYNFPDCSLFEERTPLLQKVLNIGLVVFATIGVCRVLEVLYELVIGN